MRRLVERGILTPKEREILIDAEIPATQRHNAVLVWLIRLFEEGRQTGGFEGGYGFEEQFMQVIMMLLLSNVSIAFVISSCTYFLSFKGEMPCYQSAIWSNW
jgi:hypothetical protein